MPSYLDWLELLSAGRVNARRCSGAGIDRRDAEVALDGFLFIASHPTRRVGSHNIKLYHEQQRTSHSALRGQIARGLFCALSRLALSNASASARSFVADTA